MPYVLKETDLPEFSASLRAHFPQSLQIYCQARNLMNKKCFWPGIEIVVDKFPDYSVCFTRPVPGDKDYIQLPARWYYQAVTLFAKDSNSLQAFLEAEGSGLVDWYRPVCFVEIPSQYAGVIVEKATITGHTKGFEDEFKKDVIIIKSEDVKLSIPPPLPAGCHLGALDDSHMEKIIEFWNFEGVLRGCDPEDAYPFFRYLLTHDFPSVAVFNDQKELIAYTLYGPHGNIHHGFVREDYRHRGLFQIINHQLAQKVFKELDQDVLWAHVPCGNSSLRNSYQKLGGKLHSTWKTNTLEYIVYLY